MTTRSIEKLEALGHDTLIWNKTMKKMSMEHPSGVWNTRPAATLGASAVSLYVSVQACRVTNHAAQGVGGARQISLQLRPSAKARRGRHKKASLPTDRFLCGHIPLRYNTVQYHP
jgi:hypothetical protein